MSHLDLAHAYWKRLVHPGDHVIDATCGNGFDTTFLARLLLQNGTLHGKLTAIDKQQDAIEMAKAHVEKELGAHDSIEFYHQCHSTFPETIPKESVRLVVYNLGYLPKGNKAVITTAMSTLPSLKAALDLLQPGGVISVTCYSGHPGGADEENAVLSFAKNLDPSIWNSTLHSRLNRPDSPSLLLLQKTIESL